MAIAWQDDRETAVLTRGVSAALREASHVPVGASENACRRAAWLLIQEMDAEGMCDKAALHG